MSENQMLPSQKDETIAKLYALRAGLSVIAENMEQVKQSKVDTKAREQDARHKISENNERQAMAFRKHDLEIANLKKEIANRNNTYQDATKTIQEMDKARKIGLVLLWLGILFIVLPIILILIQGHADVWIYLGLILGGVFLFVSLSRFGKVDSSIYEQSSTNINEYKRKLPILEKRLDDLKNQSPIPEYLLQEETNLQNLLDQVLEQAKESEHHENELIEESNRIYKSLIFTYSSFIVESDWKNIDLLIFYLETGRADSWKEALQLVDRQMQTNQIASAIEQASAAISKSMLHVTQALGNLMAQSFSTIYSQQQDLLSETRLQNALLKQANMTSEDLMEEVRLLQYHP